MLSGFCGDKPTKFKHLWHSVCLCISRFWRYILPPYSRPPLKMETVYCSYKNCTVSQPTISHSDAAFFPVLLLGVYAGIMKYSEVIHTHHLQILIDSWLDFDTPILTYHITKKWRFLPTCVGMKYERWKKLTKR